MNRAKKDGINFNGLYMYPINSELGQVYYNDMLWAIDYAEFNRFIIMKNTLKLLGLDIKNYIKDMINETHNHAILLPNNKLLHRKGATQAEKGIMGVIPANMRDGVYITKGLGNAEFLSSASHGAGRKFSRTQAKKVVDFDAVVNKLEELDIIVNITPKNSDENPGAYKDIKHVLKLQDGIVVDIIDHFIPKIVHIG
jgi:tRNA-splicing ligase RtcB